MKEYIEAEIEIIEMTGEDIITDSDETTDDDWG